MNQTFDLSRWLRLVGADWTEKRKRYLLALLAMGGMLIAWSAFLLSTDKFGPLNLFLQYTAYYCGLYIIGCFYASTIFSQLGNKSQAIPYLAIPASHLEKLLCGILFGVVLFFLAYTCIFYIVDIPMVSMANKIIAVLKHPPLASTLRQHGSFEIRRMSWVDAARACASVYDQAVGAMNGRR